MIAQHLAEKDRRLASANAGGLGGLVALRRGEAHLAGSHLLNPQTGEYNLSYIHEYMPGVPVRVIKLVDRQQGLIVRKGNPETIQSLRDLIRPGIHYVNHRRGAGLRVLLDYHLSRLLIQPEKLIG